MRIKKEEIYGSGIAKGIAIERIGRFIFHIDLTTLIEGGKIK
jgi:hypothetical protein